MKHKGAVWSREARSKTAPARFGTLCLLTRREIGGVI